MTNEEAIKELKYSYNENITDNEAIDMAIKALERAPCDEYGNYKYPSDVELAVPNTATSMPCGGAISRQAVLDEIFESRKNFNNEFDQGFFADKIRSLPPVIPEPLEMTGEWVTTQVENKGAIIRADKRTEAEKAYDRGFDDGLEEGIRDTEPAILDKIRAEIEQLTDYWCEANSRSAIDDVLLIIDNWNTKE